MPDAQAQAEDREVRHGGLLTQAWAYLRALGPGLITGVSDDDPATIGTMAQTGAQFGYTPLWTIVLRE